MNKKDICCGFKISNKKLTVSATRGSKESAGLVVKTAESTEEVLQREKKLVSALIESSIKCVLFRALAHLACGPNPAYACFCE